MGTFAEVLRDRIGDDHPGLLFEEERWSWDEVVAESGARAALALELLEPDRPRHVGVLLENVPEYIFWLGAVALAGVTLVGVNPTRRGAGLARDVRHTDCQLLITDRELGELLEGQDLGTPAPRILHVDGDEYRELLAAHAGAALPAVTPAETDPLLLLFTSGTTSAPKAVIYSQRRLCHVARYVTELCGLHAGDVSYLAMPLFHGLAITASYAPMVAAGGTIAMRRRFSASGFLPDVRRFAATVFTYVGRVMPYILATPERTDDAATPLRLAFGAEASHADREQFSRRFGCAWRESYGSSEGPMTITPVEGTPPGALGLPTGSQEIVIVDPDSGEPCPRARFDGDGRLVNAEEAIGEIVGVGMAGLFEGYYNNPEAAERRIRGDDVWSGDLGYRDEAGWFWYAGRSNDWLRVDSENFASAPVERILMRFEDVLMSAVYGVPDPRTGDQVMAALELRAGAAFDPARFAAFLAHQPDLGTKWAPRFVRAVDGMPLTATNKVNKTGLRLRGWRIEAPVWWRPGRELEYRLLTDEDREALEQEFEQHGRLNVLARS